MREDYMRRNLRIPASQMVYLIFPEIRDNMLPESLYIGKTKQTLDQRYKQHLSNIKRMNNGETNISSKYLWMYGIINKDVDLVIVRLLDVPGNMIYEIEKEWINYLEGCGFNLLNRANDRFYEKKTFSYD